VSPTTERRRAVSGMQPNAAESFTTADILSLTAFVVSHTSAPYRQVEQESAAEC
jgi:hypothetical protein